MRKNIICITTLMIALACLVGAGFQAKVAAQACNYPLFIQQGAVDANVMILLDNSGSMNEAIYHPAYNQNITYPGKFSSTNMYYVRNTGTYSPRSFNSKWTSTPTAPLVDSDQGEDGRYIGNYLNWIFYTATSAQRAALPPLTRIQVAKPAVNAIIDANPAIRFGVYKFLYEGPGQVVGALGTDHTTLQTTVSTIGADTWTPTGESMVTMYEELLAAGSNGIQYDCQKTFFVVVTDGLPTRDGDGNPSLPGWATDSDGDGDIIDDVALHVRQTDADGNAANGIQYVSTYTIGFGVDANVLQDAADVGDGLYLMASDPPALTAALQSVLRDIVNRISSGSAVAVVSTEGQTQDLLFRGKFKPNTWQGFLEAFELPYTPAELPLWEAGELLSTRSASSRTILTAVGGTQIAVTTAYASTLRASLGVATDAVASDLITWMRGDDVVGYRDRAGWKFGDVIDSSPLVVGPPAGFNLYGDYLTWRTANSSRPRVIYIGSNDGMVHCFREADGYELWSFIPPSQLGRMASLADPAYCHQFFCNLTPKVFDAYVNGSWRTMLMAGMKQGGDAYMALDVTDPSNPTYMWEATLPNMNGTWSAPEIVRVQQTGKIYAFVGTGPDKVTGRAYLKAIDLSDGTAAYTTLLTDNGGTGLNMATGARAIDLDFDSWHDLLYVSDFTGKTWRLDLNESPFELAQLFESDVNQPIQSQPILTVDYNNDVFMYFGTGRYVESSDINDASQQTFYSVIDKHDDTLVTRSGMVDETSTITAVGPTDRGWFIDLVVGSGERVVEPNALVASVVYFTSFAPNDQPCSAGGHSWLYGVDFRNGSNADGDDDTSNDTTDGRIEDLGDGVATKPVIDVVNEKVIVQGSDTRIHVSDAKGKIRQLIVRSWRQRYN